MAKVKHKPSEKDKDKDKSPGTKQPVGPISGGLIGGATYGASKTLTEFIGGGASEQFVINSGINQYTQRVDEKYNEAKRNALYRQTKYDTFNENVELNGLIKEGRRVRNYVSITGKIPEHSLSSQALTDVLRGKIDTHQGVKDYYAEKASEAAYAASKAKSRQKKANIVKAVLTFLAF